MRKTNQISLAICLTSYVLAALYWLFTHVLKVNILGMQGFCTLYMVVPFVLVLIMMKKQEGHISAASMGFSFRFNWTWLVAWLLPVFLVMLSVWCSKNIFHLAVFSSMEEASLEMVKDNPDRLAIMQASIDKLPMPMLGVTALSGLLAGITINAVFAFFEESAWRGYLFKQFKGQSFWKATLYIGLIWGIWHAPVILMGHNYPAHPLAGVLMMILFCLAVTPIANYLRIKCRSAVAVAIFHGTVNALAGIGVILAPTASDLLRGLPGLAGVMVIVVVDVLLVLYDTFLSKDKAMGKIS